MKIRPATAEDVDVVTDIYLRSRAGAGAAIPPEIHTPDEVRGYVADVIIAARETWLASMDDEAVGLLALDGNDIDWLWVIPQAQSRGVGTTLLAHACSRRPGGLALWTFVSNTPARRFYERRGFDLVRETDGANNEERAPDVRYVWGNHPERQRSQDGEGPSSGSDRACGSGGEVPTG